MNQTENKISQDLKAQNEVEIGNDSRIIRTNQKRAVS